jgi:hypothetical protein
MVRLTRLLARTEPSQPLADRLIAALTPTLEMDGGAITIGHEAAERSTLSATDPLAERVEELQDVLREGPSLDAFRTGRPVAATGAPPSSSTGRARSSWPARSGSRSSEGSGGQARPNSCGRPVTVSTRRRDDARGRRRRGGDPQTRLPRPGALMREFP